MDSGEFDQREFRNALGRFATGVTVITTLGADGKPEGLTANSFSALSLDPPLVLWSLDKGSFLLPIFERCECFTINVLAAGQRSLSDRFARAGTDKFAGVPWKAGLGGTPVIDGCLAHFECHAEARHEGGDHVIYVGRVARFSYGGGEPLLFAAGRYGVPAPHPADAG